MKKIYTLTAIDTTTLERNWGSLKARYTAPYLCLETVVNGVRVASGCAIPCDVLVECDLVVGNTYLVEHSRGRLVDIKSI